MDDTLEINLRTPHDVALRLLIEIGVVIRAGLESAKTKEQRVTANEDRFDLLAWLLDINAESTLTEHELNMLKEPIGKLSAADVRKGSLRLETVAILAWAINRFETDPLAPVSGNGGELL